MGMYVWVRFRERFKVSVRVMVRIRVRIIRFIQVKSGSHCYSNAAATTSHPYFGIVPVFGPNRLVQ